MTGPVPLRSRTRDDLVPLTVNQLLSGNTAGAPLELQAVLDEQYFGAGRHRQVLTHCEASIYQQDLLNLWWKMWKEQGFASLSPYGHLLEAQRLASFEAGDICFLNYDNRVCVTYRLCRVLSTEVPTDGRMKRIKIGYRECRVGEKYKPGPLMEIKVNVQQLALLVPANKKELLRRRVEKEPAQKGNTRREDEAHVEVLKDVADNINTDAASKHDFAKIAAIRDDGSDELVKDATADDDPGKDLQELAKKASLGKPGREKATTKNGNKTKEEVRGTTVLEDVTADEVTGHDAREYIKVTRPEDVALNAPRRKNQQIKKKDRKIG